MEFEKPKFMQYIPILIVAVIILVALAFVGFYISSPTGAAIARDKADKYWCGNSEKQQNYYYCQHQSNCCWNSSLTTGDYCLYKGATSTHSAFTSCYCQYIDKSKKEITGGCASKTSRSACDSAKGCAWRCG